MTEDNLTPEQSLDIIAQTINEAKSKFHENGFIYIFWGALIGATSIAQFVLLKLEHFDINYYPYFVVPLGGIFTWLYYYRKYKTIGPRAKNAISIIISSTWLLLMVNFLILGFAYWSHFQNLLIPVMLILSGIGYLISGIAIRSTMLLISGVVINASGFICIHLEVLYQPLVMGLLSLLFICIPSIFIYRNHKRKDV